MQKLKNSRKASASLQSQDTLLSGSELSAIMQNLPLAIFLVDGDRKIRKANVAASHFIRKEIEQVLECRAGEAICCVHSNKSRKGCGSSEHCECCPLRFAIHDTFEKGVNHRNVEVRMVLLRSGRLTEYFLQVSSSRIVLLGENLVLLCIQDITERKRAEEEIIKQHRLLNTLITHTEDLIYIKDKDSKFLLANSATARHMGADSPDSLIGKTDFDFLPKELSKLFYADERAVVKTGQPLINKEEPAVSPDGAPMVVSSTKVPILNVQGKVTGIIGIGRDITDRKRAEEALKVSEERYRTLVQMSPEPIFLNQDDKITFVNSAAVTFFGAKSPGELLGRSPFDLFDGRYHAPMAKKIKQLSQGQPVEALEGQARRLDGSYVYVEIIASSMLDRGRRVIQVLVRDIHERKLREAELIRLNRTLKALSDSNQAMMRAETEQDFLDEICRIIVEDCGHSMVWIGMADHDHKKTVRPVAQAGFEEGYLKLLNITWADTERGQGPTGTAIRSGKPTICRDMLKDPRFAPWRTEAQKRGYRSSVAFPLINHGITYGSLTIYSKEANGFIDDEVNALNELANDLAYGIGAIRLRQERDRALFALQESESRLLLAQEAANAGTWEWDLTTNENMFSKESWAIFGIDASRVIDGGPKWKDIVRSDDLSYVEDVVQRAAKEGAKVNVEWRVPVFSPERWVMLKGRPVKNGKGRVECYAGVVMDITERKRAEQILKRDKETLEALVEEKTRELLFLQQEAEKAKRLADIGMLSATVAHELRNPLATIRVAAFNLSRKNKDPEVAKRMRTIDQSVEESNQIINNLLFFSRIKTPHYEEVALHFLINQIVEIYKSHASLTLRLTTDAPVVVECDKLQVKELLSNLINNAVDAVSGREGVVELTTTVLKDYIQIEVRDNGVGISPEHLKSVWEPFFSTKAKGTGLGMTVCKQVVGLHNGTIEIESEVNKGTLVRVKLPLTRPLTASVPGKK